MGQFNRFWSWCGANVSLFKDNEKKIVSDCILLIHGVQLFARFPKIIVCLGLRELNCYDRGGK